MTNVIYDKKYCHDLLQVSLVPQYIQENNLITIKFKEVMVEKKVSIQIERKWFIDSKQGNIKDDYYFEKKLGSGGYGAVYLAKNKRTGKNLKFTIMLNAFPFLNLCHFQELKLLSKPCRKYESLIMMLLRMKQLS